MSDSRRRADERRRESERLERGATYREAIIGATVRRTLPVALTALAAILAGGIVPSRRRLLTGRARRRICPRSTADPQKRSISVCEKSSPLKSSGER
jgi:hypothetical protein